MTEPVPLSDVAYCFEAYANLEALSRALTAAGREELAGEVGRILGDVRAVGKQLCQRVDDRELP